MEVFSLYLLYEQYVISSQDGTVQEYAVAWLSYTQEQVCYLTVGDCCRVFLLHMMYEGVETAVI